MPSRRFGDADPLEPTGEKVTNSAELREAAASREAELRALLPTRRQLLRQTVRAWRRRRNR